MNRKRGWAGVLAMCVAGVGAGETATWQEPVTGMTFVAIPGGCFRMGADKPQPPQPDPFWERVGYKGHLSFDESPRHRVCLSPFWMTRTEVTRGQWAKAMAEAMPDDADRPQAGISWQQAQALVERLNAQAPAGRRFRLPTEAEWEYACRGGDRADVDPWEGEGARDRSWHGHEKGSPQPVAGKHANGFGLYDLLGNVWEWVEDDYAADAYRRHAKKDPVVRGVGTEKVLRGGSVWTENAQVRCAMRSRDDARAALPTYGLRLVMEEVKR